MWSWLYSRLHVLAIFHTHKKYPSTYFSSHHSSCIMNLNEILQWISWIVIIVCHTLEFCYRSLQGFHVFFFLVVGCCQIISRLSFFSMGIYFVIKWISVFRIFFIHFNGIRLLCYLQIRTKKKVMNGLKYRPSVFVFVFLLVMVLWRWCEKGSHIFKVWTSFLKNKNLLSHDLYDDERWLKKKWFYKIITTRIKMKKVWAGLGAPIVIISLSKLL